MYVMLFRMDSIHEYRYVIFNLFTQERLLHGNTQEATTLADIHHEFSLWSADHGLPYPTRKVLATVMERWAPGRRGRTADGVVLRGIVFKPSLTPGPMFGSLLGLNVDDEPH